MVLILLDQQGQDCTGIDEDLFHPGPRPSDAAATCLYLSEERSVKSE
jgi:hypothetical protein